MKFLLASLLANAALLGGLALRPSFAPPVVHDFLVRYLPIGGTLHAESTPPRAVPMRGARSAETDAPRLLGAAFQTDDLATLSARMRAAGFPAAMMVEVLRREIDARYDARIRALTAPDPTIPFWKSSPETIAASGRLSEQIGQLMREREKAYRDAVNDPFFFQDAALDIGQRRMWGDLPRDKLDRLQRIEDDYTELISAARAAANGLILPGDQEKLDLLAREKQSDLAALLSPAELAEYKLRTGSVGLPSRLRLFEPSDAEWRAIAHVQLDLNAQSTGLVSTDPTQRSAAMQTLETQLKASLGEARYADYLRTTNPEFQQLSHFAELDHLSASVTQQAFSLRDQVAQESNRIFDDPAIDPTQKRAALQALVQNTRNQILSMLGPTSGPAYVKTTSSWLTNVANGSAVTFAPTNFLSGTSPSFRRLPGPTAPTSGGAVRPVP